MVGLLGPDQVRGSDKRMNGYDAAIEIIDLNGDLFVAVMAFEEGNPKLYLECLRKAQAHLTALILDAEERADTELCSLS